MHGASYHITNRGNHQEKIFLQESDYCVYLSILKDTLKFYEEFNYKLISYCLMTNHVHLLIKTDKRDPSNFMRRINSMYAKYFNKKYEVTGHLFQGRYYSNLITNISELLEVSRYIHLNPVRAQITKGPEEYKWSSYNKIVNNKVNDDIRTSILNEKNDFGIVGLSIAAEEILDLLDIYSLVEDNSIKKIRATMW